MRRTSTATLLPQHNLDINTYSLVELLQLFELPKRVGEITSEGMKAAKRKYQMLHPDKSGLAMDYFLFYQRAFQKIEEEYLYNRPTNAAIGNAPVAPVSYESLTQTTTNIDKRTQTQINKVLEHMRPDELNQHLNQMYDTHMAKKQDTRRSDFLKNDAPIYEERAVGSIKTQNQLAQQMSQMKQQSQSLVRHKSELAPMHQTHGQRFYEDDDEDEDADEEYITSDPFSKLRFEDVRKVHGAETILLDVTDAPINSNRTIQSFKQECAQSIVPLSKHQSTALLQKIETEQKIKAEKARQNSLFKTQSYAEKNEAILRGLLRIGN